MKVSLITCTYQRYEKLPKLLRSLSHQTFKNFELIIVDQSKDKSSLNTIVEKFSPYFTIKLLHSEPGLSKARNKGLKAVQGNIIGFPDDDCWYDKTTLEKVNEFFTNNPTYSLLTGVPIDEKGNTVLGRYDKKSGALTKRNIWKRANSNTIFCRNNFDYKETRFDESLGVGSGTIYGAGEDIDFPLQMLRAGFCGYFYSDFNIKHPNPTKKFDSEAIKRGFNYGAGMGKVLKKHNYSFLFVVYQFLRPLLGCIASIVSCKLSKAKYHLKVAKGRFYGFSKQ